MKETGHVKNRSTMENSKENLYYYEGGRLFATPLPGDEVVISGLAGVFPESRDVYEFSHNLFNKINMMRINKRLDNIQLDIPQFSGAIPEIDKYDGGFFGVHERQSHSMDTKARIFQEKAVEAILDAGLHPSELQGTKTGVFVGVSSNEYDKAWFRVGNVHRQSFALTGTERSMISNRLSYFLKLKGPSYTVDTACSSSFSALEDAYRAIRSGEIESAIVAGINVCLHPLTALQFVRIGAVSQRDICRPFDVEGKGYTRSEAVVVLVLQKLKVARRTYAQIVHIKTNCDGFKEEGMTCPSKVDQMKLLTDVHYDCGVDSTSLSYIEAHGTGTQVGDLIECETIDNVLASGRKIPLPTGSVKSNMGHSEASSGLCSLIKCILAMETGSIPPNINFTRPRQGLTGIAEGRMKIVVNETPLVKDSCLMGINNFGFGGTNAYLILKRSSKMKTKAGDGLPRLVAVSGRTYEAVNVLLEEIGRNALNFEYIGLLHEIFKKNIPNHIYRGYSVVSESGNVSKSLDLCPGEMRSLYFSFGELKNWYDVGKQLMVLPPFYDAIKSLQQSLVGTSVNICDILLQNRPFNVDDASVIGTVLVQIALVNVFRLLEIQPKLSFGVFIGELVSAYCDGVLTLTETISCASTLQEMMSDVDQLPNLSSFKDEVQNEKGNLEWKAVLKFSGPRGIKNNSLNRLATSQNSILGCEEYRNIANIEMNSVILQVADSCVDRPKDVSVIPLFSKGDNDYLMEFLKALGSLYLLGYNPQTNKLCAQTDFPVGRGTPMISPSIRWNHTRHKFVPLYNPDLVRWTGKGIKQYSIELGNGRWSFISGHVIDGDENLFPFAGYFYMVWETFSLMKGVSLQTSRVSLEECQILRAIRLSPKVNTVFEVSIQWGTGKFEVVESNSTVMTGRINFLSHKQQKASGLESVESTETHHQYLNKQEVYKELRLRGLNYSGKFRAIEKCETKICSRGVIKWEENWTTFIENVIQMKMLQIDTRLLCLPTFVSKLEIDAIAHHSLIEKTKESETASNMASYSDGVTGKIKCGGLTISGLKIQSYARKMKPWTPLLESYRFVPNIAELNLHQSVKVNVQILLENTLVHKIKVLELVDEFTGENAQPLSPIVHSALNDEPLIQPFVKILSKKSFDVNVEVENKSLHNETNCLLVIASRILDRPEILSLALAALTKNGFIISRESFDFDVRTHLEDNIATITIHRTASETLLLLKKVSLLKPRHYIKIDSRETFSWLPKVQTALNGAPEDDLVLYSDKDRTSGILGLVSCLRKEPDRKNIRCVFVIDKSKEFDPDCCLYKNQLRKNMAVNVYKNGRWGTYRHLPLENMGSVAREHCFAEIVEQGNLSSIRWIEGPSRHDMMTTGGPEVICVYYSSLNSESLLMQTEGINADLRTFNRMEKSFVTGCEFSGRDQRGNRVMGISPKGCLSSLVLADSSFTYRVPDSWTFEDAATVPMTFTLVLYSLVTRGKMTRGESILIRSGSTVMRHAAIQLAFHYGCEVFTTITTQTERQFLYETYPQLEDKNIFNCDDGNLQQMILQRTRGRGVDLLLNLCSKEDPVTPVTCLARQGRFVDIRWANITHDDRFNLSHLHNEVSFHSIAPEEIFKETTTVKCEIRRIFQELVRDGVITPLNRKVFQPNEIERAFRYMANDACVEKALIKFREPETQLVALPGVPYLQGVRRYYCDSQGVYIIVGGLGGLGLELADWLVLRGARKLVLTSRKGVTTGYQNYRIGLWKSYGVAVKISRMPLIEKGGCKQLIEETQQFGAIAAVFNLAMVISDAFFESQTPESFAKCLAPKALVTRHLDELTRKACPNLRDFVVFSSVSCGRGTAEQTNYGMANSVMERICEKRMEDGYSGLAIQWGVVGEVGIVSEMKKDRYSDAVAGIVQQPITSCLEVLDILLTQRDLPVVANMVVAEKRKLQSTNNVVDTITNIIGLKDLKYISLSSTLPELGMDSMLANEIKQVLEKDFEIKIHPNDLRSMTIERLQQLQRE